MTTDNLDSLKVKLGTRIKDLRVKKGMNIRQFALLAGIEHPQLINIEKGRIDVKLATIQKIAKAFEMELTDLFRFTPNSNNPL